MNKKIYLSKGFSLMELMLVVAVVALLSSFIAASINTARAKSRDAARVATVHTLKTGLELYRSANGKYPYHNGSAISTRELVAADLSKYVTFISEDFTVENGIDQYVSDQNGSSYEILYTTETNNFANNSGCNSLDYASLQSAVNQTAFASCLGNNVTSPMWIDPQGLPVFTFVRPEQSSVVNVVEKPLSYGIPTTWSLTNADYCTWSSTGGENDHAGLDILVANMPHIPQGEYNVRFSGEGSVTITCNNGNGSVSRTIEVGRDYAAP